MAYKYFVSFLLSAIIQFQNLNAQSPKFASPLDIPILLSANFGEIRTDHLHTGYDIKTNGKTGYKVFAATDGYVSRIKVSSGGFGQVLYITHPNGYMTVYAHLDRFNDAIAKYVKDQQYSKESFEIELFPDATKFKVKKGDLIAYSGNSGNSGGPHLHFEIRDASGETFPINPKDFLPVDDRIPPKLKALFVYPLNGNAVGLPEAYSVLQTSGVYKLKGDSIVVNHSRIGIGIEVNDKMNESESDLGIYKLDMALDGASVFQMKIDRLNFLNNRYVNAHIDYKEWRETNTAIQKTFILPGDKNTIYENSENHGNIHFTDTLMHRVRIIATDANGNISVINFKIRFSGKEMEQPKPPADARLFKYDQSNNFVKDSIKLSLPTGVLYSDFYFQYKSTIEDSKFQSPVYSLHNPFVPLHNAVDLSVIPFSIHQELKSKTVIVYRNEDGKISSKISQWDGNWLTAKVRDFGDYAVMIDTVKPVIVPYEIKQNQLITRDNLRFTVTDNLTGISNYKALLDGKWVLMEYDAKNNRLIIDLEESIIAGEHIVILKVSDQVNNESTFAFQFRK